MTTELLGYIIAGILILVGLVWGMVLEWKIRKLRGELDFLMVWRRLRRR